MPENRFQEQNDLANAVAKELGEGWETVPERSWEQREAPYQIQGPNGELLSIGRVYRNKSMVYVSGNFPYRLDGSDTLPDSERPSINVSYSRGIKTIVKSIQTRLFPQYNTLLENAKNVLETSSQYFNRRKEMTQNIKQTLGSFCSVKYIHRNKSEYEQELEFVQTTVLDLYGTIEPGDKHTTLHLQSLPNDLALEILKLVREHGDKKLGNSK